MDWGRAKTILIWLFVMMNIVLGLQLYFKEQHIVLLSDRQIQDVKEVLKQNHIIVDVEIPKRTVAQSALEIRLESTEIPNIIKKIRQKGYVETEEAHRFQKGEEEIRETKKSLELLYTSPGVLFPPVSFTPDRVQKSAENMLKYLGVSPWKYKLVHIRKHSPQLYELHYSQVFKGKVIYDSEIRVRVKPKGVSFVRVATITPSGFKLKSEIHPATEALIQVMGSIESGNLKKKLPRFDEHREHHVTQISFGYYLEKNRWQSGDIGRNPFMVWRIVLDNHYVVYVKAVDLEVIAGI